MVKLIKTVKLKIKSHNKIVLFFKYINMVKYQNTQYTNKTKFYKKFYFQYSNCFKNSVQIIMRLRSLGY